MQIEACLDFTEEDIELIEQLQIKRKIQQLQDQAKTVLADAVQGKLLRDGLKLVIAGQPNAGKSSLLNALSGTDSAIVTPIEGTTRDVLTELIQIQGVPIHVLDTAGLRDLELADAVEKIGIERAWQQIRQADVVILLNDLSRAKHNEFVNKQNKLLQDIRKGIQETAVILQVDNKADVVEEQNEPQAQVVRISAKTGWGVDVLQQTILETAGWRSDRTQGICSARNRHLLSLQQMLSHLENAHHLLHLPTVTIDLLAEECRLAQNNLSDITGQFSNEDLLGEIFSRFCIGK